MSKLKVAISGLGQGIRHLHVFHHLIRDTEVIGLYTPRAATARTVATEHSISRVYQTFEDLVSDPDVDIVVVASPCAYHGEQALAALEAGKHVLVEVGLDASHMDRLWRIVKAAEAGRLKVQIGNHMRWDPRTRAMKALIDEGRIGNVFYAESEYFDNAAQLMGAASDGSATWRNGFGQPSQPTLSSGGGIHAIDTIRYLMGSEFVEVAGFGNRICYPWRDADDLQVALFKTASGAVCKVTVSKGLQRIGTQYHAVYGTEGSLEKDRHQLLPLIYFSDRPDKPGGHRPMERIPVKSTVVDSETGPRLGKDELIYLQNRDFVEAIIEDRQPLINIYEGARSSAAGICASRAIEEGRPIRIPLIPNRSDDYHRFKSSSLRTL